MHGDAAQRAGVAGAEPALLDSCSAAAGRAADTTAAAAAVAAAGQNAAALLSLRRHRYRICSTVTATPAMDASTQCLAVSRG